MNNPNIEAVLHLVNGTSNKHVPGLSCRLIQADLLIGIHQFKNSVRWKEFWLKYEEVSETDSEGVMEEDKFDEEGLNTNLRPKSESAMQGSYQLESFLTQVERELLPIGWDTEIPEKKDKDQEIRRLLQISEESEIVIVPTEKTNRFRSMK